MGKLNLLRAAFLLEVYPWLEFLTDYYVLESDFGNRFKPLRVLPARWGHGWPRYLYRCAPEEMAAVNLPE